MQLGAVCFGTPGYVFYYIFLQGICIFLTKAEALYSRRSQVDCTIE
jgi:hypothetical protein